MTTILGGGLSGLAAAYYLLRQGAYPVTIYEAGIRIGGWIRTELHKDKGFIFEQGPRTIRPKGIQGANTLELIGELQLPINSIKSTHPAALNRMIYAKQELCLLPNSLKGAFQTLPPFKKPLIASLLHDLRAGRTKVKYGDESIYDFVERRFGKEIADYAISPMICGICAGDAKEISVRFLMNDLFEKEQRFGGVLKGMIFSKLLPKSKNIVETSQPGLFNERLPSLFQQAKREKWSMYSLPNGMEQLPRSLGQYLRDNDVKINLSSDCRQIHFTEDGAKLNIKGQEVNTEFIVSAMPSFKLAAAVKSQHPSLAAQLNSIPYVDVAVINLQYPTNDLLKSQAFGFLVPPLEKLPILGVIFDSCCFDMNGNTVLTVMMGGKWFDEYFGSNPTQKELLDIALRYLDTILGIDIDPKMARVNILQKCIPQYTVGHQNRVANIRKYITNYNLPLAVCGAAYDGVGINDVVLSARRQIESLQIQTVADT